MYLAIKSPVRNCNHFIKFYKYNPTETMWSCHYHSNESLQNFCTTQQCSLPLCSKCINIHMHDNPSVHHHILSLQDTLSMTMQQLHTCLQGIRKQQATLQNQYTPQGILQSYQEILEKYRTQSIENINKYYNNLQKQIFTHLQGIFDKTLGSLHQPLKQKITYLTKLQKQLTNQNTTIKTLVTINFDGEISFMEKLFNAIKDKKSEFKELLPRLEPGMNGELIMVNQSRKISRRNQESSRGFENRILSQVERETNRLQRIALLQGQLDDIRLASIQRY